MRPLYAPRTEPQGVLVLKPLKHAPPPPPSALLRCFLSQMLLYLLPGRGEDRFTSYLRRLS